MFLTFPSVASEGRRGQCFVVLAALDALNNAAIDETGTTAPQALLRSHMAMFDDVMHEGDMKDEDNFCRTWICLVSVGWAPVSSGWFLLNLDVLGERG